MTNIIVADARIMWRSPEPRDILIRDGHIAAIAPAGASFGSDTAANTERISVEGRTVAAGLWDHHIHMNQWALARRRVDVSAAESAAHAASIVSDHLSESPEPHGSVLVGYGFRDGLWADEPSAELLRVGDTAVVLISGDLHAAWFNTAAAQLLGMPTDSSCILRESAAIELSARVGEVSTELLDTWVAEAARAAARRGVVGVVDLDVDDAPAQWLRRSAQHVTPVRVRAGIYPAHLDRAKANGYRSGHVLDGATARVSVGPLKIITDGSLNTRTALCYDRYPDQSGPDAHGISRYSTAELISLLREGQSIGLVPTVHAIGDHANTMALDAFDAVGVRGMIEHAQMVARTDLPRFAALGVTASVQPEHAVDDRDVADRHWPGRTDLAFAFRSLIDAGADVVLGSDAPVAPLDPWVTMAAAVHRTRGDREPWHPEQRIHLDEAYRASARTSVSVGDVADIVVTDLDPRDCDAEQLRNMPVSGTLIAGSATHWTI